MTLLAVPSSAVARRALLCPWTTAAFAAALVLHPPSLAAQGVLTHFEDASPIPRGVLRFRVANVWSRYDQTFAQDGGVTDLGRGLSTDSLGPRQLPGLAPLEAGLQTLTGNDGMRLTLGPLETRGDARIVTTPIAVEYGVTRRLSIGVLVPVVQTRRVTQIVVDRDSSGNTGYIVASTRREAGNQNNRVATAFQQAANDLRGLITRCQTTPSGAGCAPVVANPGGAATARDQADKFAAAVRAFGINEATAILAPRANSTLAASIEFNRNALNDQLRQYLGPSAGASESMFFAAHHFTYLDLQGGSGLPGLLKSTLGGGLDSLHTTERIGLGDIAVGAQFLVFDQFQTDSLPRRGIQSRLMIGGAYRFATSRPDSAQNLSDISTGDGAGIEGHAAFDLIAGRVGGTVAARYVKHFARTVTAPLYGDPEGEGFPYPVFGPRDRTAGDVLTLDVTPRVFVTDWMAIDAHYGVEHTGATQYGSSGIVPDCSSCVSLAPPAPVVGQPRTAQRLGLGLRYSTVDAYARRQARYPMELTFAHLETITGSAGVPKISRDQIELRVFVRVLGGGR